MARVVESDRECFLRHGIRNTRMSDVDAGAGMVVSDAFSYLVG
jgi:hypothetical protein